MSEYIDLNTVLSEFNEKGTLLKWLKKLEGESSGINERLDDAEAKIAEHSTSIFNHGLSIGTLTGLVSGLAAGAAAMREDIDDEIKPAIAELNDTVQGLSDTISLHDTSIGILNTEVAALDARVESLEDSASLLSQAIAKLQPYYVRVVVSGTTAAFADYSYEALCTAIANGSNIVLYDGPTALAKDNLYYLSYNINNASFEFSNNHYFSSDGDKIRLRVLRISSNTINVITKTIA